VGQTPSLAAQTANLESFTALGVEVAYTELDIRFTSLPPSTSGYQQQATDYVNTVGACLATTNCVGITVWDFTDLYSWIPSTFSGQGDACLWNSDFSTKPAYTSVISLLGGSAPTGTPTSTSTSSSSSPTTTSSGGSIPKYSQCAGLTWGGSGTCIAGTTCVYSNAYYSQCL
jgi:endo-1,4-beta-xylanase